SIPARTSCTSGGRRPTSPTSSPWTSRWAARSRADRTHPDPAAGATPAPFAGSPPPSRWLRAGRPVRGSSVGEVLGRLADLPIAVLTRPGQRGVDLGAVERRQGQHGSASHGGLVPGRREDGREAAGIADGA